MYSVLDIQDRASAELSDLFLDSFVTPAESGSGANIATAELEAVLDVLPDVVFYVKDADGRYTHVNLTMVRRLGLKHRSDVIGRHVKELYSAPLGEAYTRQDERVLRGETIENQLEVQAFPNRSLGWCLTHKRPLVVRGEIRGIVGISRDLGQPDGEQPIYPRLLRVIEYLQEHYAENLRVQALAELAEVSVAQLERHFRRVFQLTPQQMLTKLRIEAAVRLLRGVCSVADISQACGFADQSAFARQFKAIVGMTPRDYRREVLEPPTGSVHARSHFPSRSATPRTARRARSL